MFQFCFQNSVRRFRLGSLKEMSNGIDYVLELLRNTECQREDSAEIGCAGECVGHIDRFEINRSTKKSKVGLD